MLKNKAFTSHFHDGSIIDITHTPDKITISMESAEIAPEDPPEKSILTVHNTLKGILHLKQIQSIRIDKQFCQESLHMKADSAGILDFEINENSIRLFIEWVNYPPHAKLINTYSEIIIEANKIYWENIPDLYDPFG